MNNEFEITILEDGKISVKSIGGFSSTIHKDADAFLAFIKELAGGEVTTKKATPNLGNPQQGHTHGHKHHHH